MLPRSHGRSAAQCTNSYWVSHSAGEFAIKADTNEQAIWVALHECEAQGSELIELHPNVEEQIQVFPTRLGDDQVHTRRVSHRIRL